MTPMEAIVVATKANAELLDWEDQLGTSQAGKLADILLVDGNPLKDISVLRDPSNIRRIIQGGQSVVLRSD